MRGGCQSKRVLRGALIGRVVVASLTAFQQSYGNRSEAGTLQPGKVVRRKVGLDEVTEVFEAMGNYDTTGLVVIDRFR